MSRRNLQSDDYNKNAAFGWDNPLQNYFLDITGDDCSKCDGDGCDECEGNGEVIVFSSHLGDPRKGFFTLEALEAALLEHGFFFPDQILTTGELRKLLEQDRATGA